MNVIGPTSSPSWGGRAITILGTGFDTTKTYSCFFSVSSGSSSASSLATAISDSQAVCVTPAWNLAADTNSAITTFGFLLNGFPIAGPSTPVTHTFIAPAPDQCQTLEAPSVGPQCPASLFSIGASCGFLDDGSGPNANYRPGSSCAWKIQPPVPTASSRTAVTMIHFRFSAFFCRKYSQPAVHDRLCADCRWTCSE